MHTTTAVVPRCTANYDGTVLHDWLSEELGRFGCMNVGKIVEGMVVIGLAIIRSGRVICKKYIWEGLLPRSLERVDSNRD